MKYFLITGMAKSGTTWVQRICRAHPEMHCRAEDQFTKFWSRIQTLVNDYNELIQLRDRERDNQGVETLDKQDATKLFYAMVQMTLDKAPPSASWSGIKELILSAIGFLTYIPESRVINVIRDPRDMAISALAHSRRIKGLAEVEPPVLGDRAVSEACHHWVKQMRLNDDARARFPGKTHDIRYEDLITDFAGTTRTLLDFFGVDSSPAIIELLRRETDFQRLSGGRAPGDADEASYFRKGVAGEWRNTLNPDQIALVEWICGGDLKAQGYDLVHAAPQSF